MISALFIGIVFIPTLANLIFSIRFDKKKVKIIFNSILTIAGISLLILSGNLIALVLVAVGINNVLEYRWPPEKRKYVNYINIALTLAVVLNFLTRVWMPLGAQNSFLTNFLFLITLVGIILGILMTIVHFYPYILNWCLSHKWQFLSIPIAVVLFGIITWLGVPKMFGFLPDTVKKSGVWKSAEATFPGCRKGIYACSG